MVNKDYTYFELTARDEFILNLKIVGLCWILNVLWNIFTYLHGGLVSIFIISQCIGTILLAYIFININKKNANKKELMIDEDGIMLYNWLDKNYHTLKWYQIKSVQVKNKSTSECGWILIVETNNDAMHFMFSPYYWYAKPKKCIKVLENCVDVRKKLIVGK